MACGGVLAVFIKGDRRSGRLGRHDEIEHVQLLTRAATSTSQDRAMLRRWEKEIAKARICCDHGLHRPRFMQLRAVMMIHWPRLLDNSGTGRGRRVGPWRGVSGVGTGTMTPQREKANGEIDTRTLPDTALSAGEDKGAGESKIKIMVTFGLVPVDNATTRTRAIGPKWTRLVGKWWSRLPFRGRIDTSF